MNKTGFATLAWLQSINLDFFSKNVLGPGCGRWPGWPAAPVSDESAFEVA